MSLASLWQRLLDFLFPTDPAGGSSPVEVFEEAIRGSRQRFLDVRATAAPLYQSRENLRQQEQALVAEVAALKERALSLLKKKREPEALELAARQGRLEADLAKIRLELADALGPISRVDERLHRLEAEVRDLERERDRSATVLKGAEARVAVDRILSAGRDEKQLEALGEARDQVVATVAKARALEELSAGDDMARLEALDSGRELDEARVRLEGMKAALELSPGETAGERDGADREN